MTSERPPPRRAASDDEGDDDAPPGLPPNSASIADELLRRHGRSQQPSSARLVALLKATLDVLASRGLSATPGALFAALMPALETELQSGDQRDEVRVPLVLWGMVKEGEEGGMESKCFSRRRLECPPSRRLLFFSQPRPPQPQRHLLRKKKTPTNRKPSPRSSPCSTPCSLACPRPSSSRASLAPRGSFPPPCERRRRLRRRAKTTTTTTPLQSLPPRPPDTPSQRSP